MRLETLDWGGPEQCSMVLLAGYRSAHVFDEFAPKLTSICHVVGITRRGFGASSTTPTGYGVPQSASDVLAVLTALHIRRAILIGHSFGAQDMTDIAERAPERVQGLVYLDSAEDPTSDVKSCALPGLASRPEEPDSEPQGISFAQYREWQLRWHGVAFPEAELRSTFTENADGTIGAEKASESVESAMFQGLRKPHFERVHAPVLALFREPEPLAAQLQRNHPTTSEQQAALALRYAQDVSIVSRHVAQLQSGVPKAKIIRYPGANFYIFLSNQDAVVQQIKAAAAGPLMSQARLQ